MSQREMQNHTGEKILERSFYERDVLTVARELPGKIFVKKTDGHILTGKIVEVEAYDGSIDEAAHTFRGKTPRNEVMFGPGGFLYVYFTYGMYYCCNVVTGNEGEGRAVLIRALEPLTGDERMAFYRFGSEKFTEKQRLNLTTGPGKLCGAFDINRLHNGTDLLGESIFLLWNEPVEEKNMVVTTRIGIKKSVDLPWRFYIKDNPFVSRK